ncbi:response regulator [Mucilaginibacter koreensis]
MKSLTNVFVIDDDKTFVFLTKKIIQSAPYAVKIEEFNDGQQAIDYLRQNAGKHDMLPDVIFLDLSMPVMDGWEFINEYQHLQPSIAKDARLYIVSSSISPHDIERSRHLEVVADFIIKPLVKGKFAEIVESLPSH